MFSGKGIYEAEDTMDLAVRLCADDRALGHQVNAYGCRGVVSGVDDRRDHRLAGDRGVFVRADQYRPGILSAAGSLVRPGLFHLLLDGSTFGTFGLILPIAAEIVVSVDLSLLIPAFGAVLAGAIFGDHTSPLSDTTILSSIGSGIQLIDHTTTQIPYALVCAVASLLGFIVLGFTRSTMVGLLTTLAALAVVVFVLRSRSASGPSRGSEAGGITG